MKKEGRLNSPLILPLFWSFDCVLIRILDFNWRSKHSLCFYFFERNPGLQSELENSKFENLTSHRDMSYSKVRTGPLRPHRKNLNAQFDCQYLSMEFGCLNKVISRQYMLQHFNVQFIAVLDKDGKVSI